MDREDLEALSAFVDGERVRPAKVTTALRNPDASEFLVGCALIRWELGEVERPRASWVHETRRRLSSRAPVWLAAAGIAATLLFGALWISRPPTNIEAESLPEVDRVIRLERGRDWSG